MRASRALYLTTAERAVKAARHDKRWGDVGRIRREQAQALYQEAGSPVPPPADIAELHREGLLAVLRSLQLLAKDVELVSAGCCPACRADDEQAFRIAAELRTPRLPHDGCPKGLCGCDWWPAVIEPRKPRRRAAAARPAPDAVAAPDGEEAVAGVEPEEGDAAEAGLELEGADAVSAGLAIPADPGEPEPEPDPDEPGPDPGEPWPDPAQPDEPGPPPRARRSRSG